MSRKLWGATTLKGRDTYGELEKVRPEGFPENGCSAYVGALFSPGGIPCPMENRRSAHGISASGGSHPAQSLLCTWLYRGGLPMRGEENGRNVRRHAPPAVTVWTEGVTSLFQGFPAQAKQI